MSVTRSKNRRDLVTLKTILLVITIWVQGCVTHSFHIGKNPLPTSASEEAWHTIQRHSEQFIELRGRFSAQVKKPGIDLAFQGLFHITHEGSLQLEIHSPFRVVTHRFTIANGVYHYLSPEESVTGSIYEPLTSLQKQWGFSLAPVHLLSLFAGNFVDSTMLQITPKAWCDNRGFYYFEVSDPQRQNLLETLVYRPQQGQIIGRIIPLEGCQDILEISLSYDEVMSQSHDSPEIYNLQQYVPKKAIVRQKGLKASLHLTFSALKGSFKSLPHHETTKFQTVRTEWG